MASGVGVHTALSAQDMLSVQGIMAQVVAFPSWELFAAQSQEYRDEVLPPSVTARVVVEAGTGLG